MPLKPLNRRDGDWEWGGEEFLNKLKRDMQVGMGITSKCLLVYTHSI